MNTKELILRTAFSLFASENFESVSMSRLEKATGLSKGAFYHHFRSKEEIFIQAMDRFFFETSNNSVGEAETEAEAGAESNKPTVMYDSFRAFFSSRLPSLTGIALQGAALQGKPADDFPLFGIMTTALRHYPDFAEKAALKEAQEVAIWTSAIEEARAKGELIPGIDAGAVAVQFLAIADGVGIRAMLTGRQEFLKEELIRQFEQLYHWIQYRPQVHSCTHEGAKAPVKEEKAPVKEEKATKADKQSDSRNNSLFVQQSLF